MSNSEIYDKALKCIENDWDYATAAEYMGKINYKNSEELAEIYQNVVEVGRTNQGSRFINDRFYYCPEEFQQAALRNLCGITHEEYKYVDGTYSTMDNKKSYCMTFQAPNGDEGIMTICDIQDDGSFGSIKIESESMDLFAEMTSVSMVIFCNEHSTTYSDPLYAKLVDDYPAPLVVDGLKFELLMDGDGYTLNVDSANV